MAAPIVQRIPLDTALRDAVFAVPGVQLVGIRVPSEAAATVRLQAVTERAFPLDAVGGVTVCAGFDRFYVTAAAVPGEYLEVLVCPAGVEVTPAGGGRGLSAVYNPDAEPVAVGDNVPLAADEFGRVYVRLGDRLSAELDAVEARPMAEAFVFRAFTAAENAAGVRHSMDTAYRPHVTAWASLAAAGDVRFQASKDGATWRTLQAWTLAAAGECVYNAPCGYRYVAWHTPTAGVAFSAEISARG